MSFFEGLHKLVLGPIELLLDVIFALSMQMTKNPVLSHFNTYFKYRNNIFFFG